MADFIDVEIPWDSQPQEATGPNPEWPSLRELWTSQGSRLGGIVGGNPADLIGGASIGSTDKGLALYTPSNGQYASVGGGVVYATTTSAWSFAAWVRLRTFGGSDRFKSLVYLRSDGSSTYAFEIFASNHSTYDGWNIGAPDGWARQRTTSAVSLGEWQHIGVTYNGAGLGNASNTLFFLNGVIQPMTTAGGFGASGKSQRTLFSDDISNQQWEGDILDPVVASAAWPEEKFRQLYENHWQLFAPQTIPVPVSAGGGTTISGNLGTAVSSGHTGNVNANRTIAGALGTASASGLQGNVNANRTIAGALGVATASGLAGNVNANRTIAGSLGVAVASGLQGAVSNSNNTVIAGNLGVAVASGLAANVNANTTIAGNIGVAVASGFSGSVLNGGGQPELQHHGAWGAPLSQDKLRQMELESEAEMIEIIAMLCGAGVIA